MGRGDGVKTVRPERKPGDPDWRDRKRSQRNAIVEGLQIVQGTLTAATGAATTVNPQYAIYGILAKGVLEGITWGVNRFWKK